MTKPTNVVPTTFQAACLSLTERCHLLIAGGRGSGKSMLLAFIATEQIARYGKEAKILICRRTINSLQQLMLECAGMFRTAFGEVSINMGANTIFIPSKESLVVFSALAQEDQYYRHQGASYGAILIDEVGALSNLRLVNLLRTCLRTTVEGRRPLMCLAANPLGKAHTFLKRQFIDKAPPWTVFQDSGGLDWVWTMSNHESNPHLPASYAQEIRAGCEGNAVLEEAFLTGTWPEIGGGLMFDYVPDVHAIAAFPRDCDPVWTCGYDYGSASPQAATLIGYTRRFSGVGHMRIPSGSYIIADECCSCLHDNYEVANGMGVGAFAGRLKDMLKRNNAEWASVACDNSRGLHGAHDTVVGVFRENSLNAVPVRQKGRAGQWALLRELMSNTRTGDGRPLFIVANRCPHFVATLPNFERHPLYMEDIADVPFDHHLDSMAYGLVNAHNGHVTVGRLIIG